MQATYKSRHRLTINQFFYTFYSELISSSILEPFLDKKLVNTGQDSPFAVLSLLEDM